MRGRIGGRIGVSSSPASGYTSGVWRLADVYAAKAGAYGFDPYGMGQPWPTRNLTITWPSDGYYGPPIDYADATETGSATFNASVSGDYSLNGIEFAYYWERSTDGGATWATVSGSSGTFTLDSYGTTVSLTRTGQTISNDDDKYRLVVANGLKNAVGQSGTMRFDSVTFSGSSDASGSTLTSNFNNYYQNLTVASGVSFMSEAGGVFIGTKYGGSYYPEAVVLQTSTDGGATWQDETGFDSYQGYVVKYYTSSSSDNGKKWRAKMTFRGQDSYTGVATLTVT